ncbi:MAG: protein translocase subunit SecF [Bryobacteraceae bacterium]
MEIFKATNFDFLGRKWPFIGLSLLLTACGLVSLWIKGGPKYGIDFNGGALMHVRFSHQPPTEKIRSALRKRIRGEIDVQEISGQPEVLVSTEVKDERTLNLERQQMVEALNDAFGNTSGKLDINNTGATALADRLRDPLQRASVPMTDEQLQSLAKAILAFRDSSPRSGLIRNLDELSSVPGVTPQVLQAIRQECYAGIFSIREVEIVGPRIGADLRHQAVLVVLYALAAMLIYIAFRFEWIYGVAAVIAVFHDTIITIGLFSIFNKPIDLTVLAALLTLVGYSMNDTIVTFDRIRENIKLQRRGSFSDLVNLSINQTLSRTVLTSGLTLLTALSLYVFGGQVLNGFSFALVIGILVGTYSSIFVASPILIFWKNFADQRKKSVRAVPAATRNAAKAAK